MSFFENTRKPVGLGGKIMVAMMNLGHSPVARWGLRFLELAPDAKVLDCGCGGGANIKRLLKQCPEGSVKGIDYSPVSVEKSKKVNEAAIAEGRCTVLQGSVADMIFADNWFDAVTAFETVYFWSDLLKVAFLSLFFLLKSLLIFVVLLRHILEILQHGVTRLDIQIRRSDIRHLVRYGAVVTAGAVAIAAF